MAKVKYYAKENSTIGTHSFYAVPIPNGTLSFDELLDEAMDGKSVEPSIAKACVTDGVLLGQQYGRLFVARTFITYDMCSGLQQQEFETKRKDILTDEEMYQRVRMCY